MATQRNEGEGSRTAAREYNEATTEFAKSGKVPAAAAKAKKSFSSPAEAAELARAEAAGRRPAKSSKAGKSSKARAALGCRARQRKRPALFRAGLFLSDRWLTERRWFRCLRLAAACFAVAV
ncbi:MAG: hypothetical protein K2P94_01995, partial [Rhodospirillaceae bacterium]|nr:hypothetical protein [Rhodospirillaceae bacterium]